ncbi:MAG: condensation domain-containing protein, partial [Bradymonadaceae bacterium]
EVAAAIRDGVTQEHRIEVADVVLIKPGSVPKTSSGKIQRNKCRKLYLADDLDELGRVTAAEAASEAVPQQAPEIAAEELLDASYEDRISKLVPYLTELVAYVVERPPDQVSETPLTSLGVDSLTAMELQGVIEQTLGVRLLPSVVLGGAKVTDVAVELAGAEFAPPGIEVDEATGTGTEPVAGLAERSRTETVEFTTDEHGLAELSPTADGSGSARADGGAPMSFSEDEIPGPEETRDLERALGPTERELSSNERGFWLYQKTHPESWAANLYATVRLGDEISYGDVVEAVGHLTARYLILRSHFPVKQGVPVCRVQSDEAATGVEHVEALEWSEEQFREAVEREARRPFDLEGGPVVRFRFYDRPDGAVFGLTVHHIAADLWSLEEIVRELAELVSAQPEEQRPNVTYADFSDWQRQMLDSARGRALRGFWKEQLAEPVSRLTFPVPSNSSDQPGYGREVRVPLDEEIIEAVERVAATHQTTAYTVLLAAYQTLLYRWTGQTEFRVGVVAAGRTRSFFEEIVGPFINVLPIRVTPKAASSFGRQIDQTRETLLEAMDAQEYPLQEMIEEFDVDRQGAGNPLVQTIFASEQPRRGQLGNGGVEPLDMGQAGTAFDLSVQVLQQPDGSGEVRFQYDESRFEEAFIEQLARAYGRMLDRAVAHPEQSIGRLGLADGDENRTLLDEWAKGADVVMDRAPVHRQFEQQALEHPNRVAVTFEDGEWTYAELNRRANRLANRLRESGVRPGDPVGVSVERSPQLIAALYGVLKAGAAY